MRIREQDMINSISIDLAFKKDVCRENKVKYLLSLTPMVTEKVVSEGMAKKIAVSGLCFRHLCIAFRRSNREGLSKLLSEKSGKRVTVTNQRKILTRAQALFTSGSGSFWNLKAGVYTEPAGFDRAQVETRSTFKTDLKTNEVRTGQVS